MLLKIDASGFDREAQVSIGREDGNGRIADGDVDGIVTRDASTDMQ